VLLETVAVARRSGNRVAGEAALGGVLADSMTSD
jgi:hypothetical protein